MILVDFSKIAHWESAGGKVNLQVIAVLNWPALINQSVSIYLQVATYQAS